MNGINFENYLPKGKAQMNTTLHPQEYDVTQDLEDLLSDMVTFLVDDNAVVHITTAKSANKIIFSVMVPPREMGKIIGKKGVLIKSLTTLFKALGNKYSKVVEIELVEPRITVSP